MRVRTTLVGNGTSADPLRSRFPTAMHFQRDPVALTIIVDIPDDDLPPGQLQAFRDAMVQTPDGPILTQLTPALRGLLIAFLKQRYPGAPGLDNLDVR